MNEAYLFGSAALLILLIAVAYMSTTQEGGEGGDGSKGGGVCPVNRPVVGPSADVPPPPSKRERSGFYDDLDDVKKRRTFITKDEEERDREYLIWAQKQLAALRTRGDDPGAPEKKPKETNLDTDLVDDVRERLFDYGYGYFIPFGEKTGQGSDPPIGGPKPPHEALHSQQPDVCRTDGDLRGQVMTSKMAACKPRSIASIKRMRTKEDANRGVPGNETEWGVCAFDDAIMDPLYPEYLKYLERMNKGGERIENEARNQMHDVLNELLNRPKLLSDAEGDRIENEARNRMHDVLVELNKKSGNWVTDRTKARKKVLGADAGGL